MPDDFDRLLEIAKLDRGDVRQIVVPLRGIVVQPLNDVVHAARVDDDRRLTPHDVDATDGVAELPPERVGRRIQLAAAMRDILAASPARRARCRARCRRRPA